MKTGHELSAQVAYSLGNFKCPQCNMNTPKKEVLIWHLSHHVGDHMITYYVCSICHAEKHYTRDIIKHFNQKHGKRIKTLECTSLARFQPVHYLENIMKCPVCNDGLLWKQIFVEHLRDKHNLLDLANYIETNYDDSCPCMLSVPGHLVKSCTTFGSDIVAEVTKFGVTVY